MSIASGYITTWNAVAFLEGATTRKATTYTSNGVIVRPRLITLPNGTLANYDGSGPSPTTPGTISQEFFDTAGATFLDTLEGQKGIMGTLVMKKAESAGTESVSAILINVQDTTPVQGNRDRVWGRATWRIVGDWA